MSFIDIKPYIEETMFIIDRKFNQWEDFNLENIPSSILDKAWHLSINSASYVGTAQLCLGFRCPITLHVHLKGYRAPEEAVVEAWKLAYSIIREATKPIRRLNQAAIKNVLPGTVTVRPYSANENDNIVVLEMTFNIDIIICSDNS